MNRKKPEARGLLRKAEGDLQAVHCLAKDSAISVLTIGFHAQQAVKEALKSVLLHRNITYPFTHDIRALTALLEAAQAPTPPSARELAYLTPFGTLFRYEDGDWDLPASMDLDRMVLWAESTVAWAREVLSGADDRNTL